MRFNLLERILEVQPGQSLKAYKNLTLGEEYLADHFPMFPVMPGVLMLQTLVEAGSWLLRVTDDFRFAIVTLREARNVKYGTFMEPGRQLRVAVELIEQAGGLATLKGKGEADGSMTVSARFTLARYNLRDRDPALALHDERLAAHWRSQYQLLRGGLDGAVARSFEATGPATV
jgi:3-hydroxyacyl-[acyl-carrier-protein] dehydratase